MQELRFIDLFAGIGGIRLGLEQAAREAGYTPVCVFTSEIKPYAVNVLQQNHPNETIAGDITLIAAGDIPDFDILCAGFPCQAFSAAGKRNGFADTRGTLFFDVERIIKEKKPKGFILENVEGLINHDSGRTLITILTHLKQLGYHTTYRLLNSKDFGVPQERKRVYITGAREKEPDLNQFELKRSILADILDNGLPTLDNDFTRKLFAHYTIDELRGKSLKDKRGGKDNIHSWDIGTKGETTTEEKALLNKLFTERRKKKWAAEYGIAWMDGMALTEKMISTFFPHTELHALLESLTSKGYLVREYAKQRVKETTAEGLTIYRREQDNTLPLAYNIVTGKLSFEINKILDPRRLAPTLVAMDMARLAVPDGKGLRHLTLREGLRLFGYPEDYKFDINDKNGYDLLGNTVVVPVIKAVCAKLLNSTTL